MLATKLKMDQPTNNTAKGLMRSTSVTNNLRKNDRLLEKATKKGHKRTLSLTDKEFKSTLSKIDKKDAKEDSVRCSSDDKNKFQFTNNSLNSSEMKEKIAKLER